MFSPLERVYFVEYSLGTEDLPSRHGRTEAPTNRCHLLYPQRKAQLVGIAAPDCPRHEYYVEEICASYLNLKIKVKRNTTIDYQ